MGQKTDTDPEKMPDETYQEPDNGKIEIPEGSEGGGRAALFDEDEDLDEDIEVGEYEEYDSGDDDFEEEDFKDFDDGFEEMFDEDGFAVSYKGKVIKESDGDDDIEESEEGDFIEVPGGGDDIKESDGDGDIEESDGDDDIEEPDGDDDIEEPDGDDDIEESDGNDDIEESDGDDDIEEPGESGGIDEDDGFDEDGDIDEDDYIDEYDDPDEYDEDDDSEEAGSLGLNLFTILVMLIAAAITAVYFTCNVKTVRVTGSTLYTSREIAEQVISDDTQLRHNSVFLAALYMTPWAPKIPFVESVRVSLDSPDSITITVRDMDIAGYIPYAGKNLYFSADGIVLENSPLTIRNAAFVTGLSITKGEIGSRMEAENAAGLDLVLSALEILRKYELHTESIYLGKTGGVTMYLDQIKVQLGRTDFELKISKIAQIYPYLEGRSGTINMTNYSSSDENIILK